MIDDNNYTKHVEVNNNIMWHAGSNPATSTLLFCPVRTSPIMVCETANFFFVFLQNLHTKIYSIDRRKNEQNKSFYIKFKQRRHRE